MLGQGTNAHTPSCLRLPVLAGFSLTMCCQPLWLNLFSHLFSHHYVTPHHRLPVSLPRGALCDLLYALHAALPGYSPQQLLQVLQLLPAWRSPPAAAVNAKNTLIHGWCVASHRFLHQQQNAQSTGSSSSSMDVSRGGGSSALQAAFAAAAVIGLGNAHAHAPEVWLQSVVLVLMQHWQQQRSAVGVQGQGQVSLNPDELSRVVLALAQLRFKPQAEEAQGLVQATQVSRTIALYM